ncbi:MAG: hypothetical protein IID32_10625 [Planctomycetes bacterium]|nr:hypothetical protein [Planctomycetota bacterium]
MFHIAQQSVATTSDIKIHLPLLLVGAADSIDAGIELSATTDIHFTASLVDRAGEAHFESTLAGANFVCSSTTSCTANAQWEALGSKLRISDIQVESMVITAAVNIDYTENELYLSIPSLELSIPTASTPVANGGIFAIRTKLYQQLPPHAVTEDQVLGMKIMTAGHTCRFAPTACATETVSSLSGELRRRIRISAGNFQSLFLVPAILSPARGAICFSFISHKLMRWLVPFFLVAMLITNSLLAGLSGYSATLMFQGLFYASGLLAACLPKLTGVLKVLAIPKYFIAMNIAILIGFARFVTQKQKVAWAKSTRR